VIDFVQLDPGTARFKDCVIHVYGKVNGDSTSLSSSGYHYIGEDSSIQPNNPGFIVQALCELYQMEFLRDDELIVIFADNGIFIQCYFL
jgi:hypothetical protein